jgi:hypothetical protein
LAVLISVACIEVNKTTQPPSTTETVILPALTFFHVVACFGTVLIHQNSI